MFCFDIDAFEVMKKNADVKEIEEVMKRLNGRCEDGYYYKQEYIFCIICDILFNAIKVCRNWQIDLHRFFHEDKNKNLDSVFSEDEMTAQYYILKNEEKKCRISIHIKDSSDEKIQYLVLKNKVQGRSRRSINEENAKLEENIASKETVGMSIQAMKWYTETLGGQDKVQAKFYYEWNECLQEVEFVTELPILSREER